MQLYNEQARRAAEVIRDCTVPLFRRMGEWALDFEGSGVLLEVDSDHRFLISAAHVFEALADGVYLLASGREDLPLKNPARVVELAPGQKRVDDPVDVGYVRLTRDEAVALGENNFIRPHVLAPRDASAFGGAYLALGYPARDQERLARELLFKITPMYYWGSGAKDVHYTRTRLDRRTHILIASDPKRVRGPNGAGGLASMSGVSGSGVWRFRVGDDYRPDNLPKLAGVFLGHPKEYPKAYVAARIQFTIEQIRADFPHLSSCLPTNLDVGVTFASSDPRRRRV